MENRKIKINYQDSGVKTANGFGTFFFVIGVIAILVAIIGLIMCLFSYRETAAVGVALASSFFPIAIGSFAAGAICKALSTIAMTSLYKRALLEDQYSFVDSFDETNELKSQKQKVMMPKIVGDFTKNNLTPPRL